MSIVEASAIVSGLLSERAKASLTECAKLNLVREIAETMYIKGLFKFTEDVPDKEIGDIRITAKLRVIAD